MKNKPMYSILIPTVGRTALIKMAVQSIIEQDGVDPEKVEIIVANCLSDNSLEEELQTLNDSRIHFFKIPGGDPSVGFDYAYKQSQGKYVIFFDDDDYMLPGALKIFAEVAEAMHPDAITAQHLYYYDRSHPRRDRRNSVGVVPFDGRIYSLSPRDILKSLYRYSSGSSRMQFRLRAGSTFFSREVCERAIKRLGFIMIPYMRTSHSQQPILFAFTESCIGVSIPTTIVGRLGSSLTQNFRMFQKKNTRPATVFKYSPVTGDLMRNHMAESMLAVKHLLPEIFEGINFDMNEFLSHRYGHELFFSTLNFKTNKRLWAELETVAKKLISGPHRKDILVEIKQLKRLSYMVQPLKSLGVWNLLKDLYHAVRNVFGKGIRRTFGRGELLIRLNQHIEIKSIEDLANNAYEIVLEKTGKDIKSVRPISEIKELHFV